MELNLVDPDNRRPVDYVVRESSLLDMSTGSMSAPAWLATGDARVKQFVIRQALSLRANKPDVFVGTYTALPAFGSLERHVIAFARSQAEDIVVAIATRLPLTLAGDRSGRWGGVVWRDTEVRLPLLESGWHWRDTLSDNCMVHPRVCRSPACYTAFRLRCWSPNANDHAHLIAGATSVRRSLASTVTAQRRSRGLEEARFGLLMRCVRRKMSRQTDRTCGNLLCA